MVWSGQEGYSLFLGDVRDGVEHLIFGIFGITSKCCGVEGLGHGYGPPLVLHAARAVHPNANACVFGYEVVAPFIYFDGPEGSVPTGLALRLIHVRRKVVAGFLCFSALFCYF